LVSNGFWHIVSVVKEQDLPVMQKGYEQLNEYLNGRHYCQPLICDFHMNSQRACKSIWGGRIQVEAKKHLRIFPATRKMNTAKKTNSGRYAELPRSVFSALQDLGLLQNVKGNTAKIGVAVSGGADSVALLRLLVEARQAVNAKIPFEIAVLHFNHQLRGQAADADEKFVRQLAYKHALQFYTASANVAAAARRAKRNVEDAGRRERYAFFARLVNYGLVSCVATAHTMDDQAETVLGHILRGTGLAGLAGIHARAGDVVRPLLGVRRADLRKYLKLRKQRWREDASNRDTTRTRAHIREKLIPLLKRQFQAKIVAHLAQLAELARNDEEYLDGVATQKFGEYLKKGGRFRFLVADLAGPGVAAALRGRLVRQIVNTCKTRPGELSAQHVARVLQLAERGENGKSLQLPGGVEVRKERDTLLFQGAAGPRKKSVPIIEYEYPLAFSDGATMIAVPSLMRVFRFRRIDWVGERGETSGKRAVVDCSRISGELVLRNWRAGDRLQPAGRSRVYKLKRLLNARGISRWERNGWPVLMNESAMVWARGFPVAAEFAANDGTRLALVIDEEAL
jgi:tRNA(Ile)-lysidine synthase